MNILNPYRHTATTEATVYDDATVVWSLRKVFDWDNAVMKLWRTSDNAEAWVFFDGAIPYDEVTLNSYISTIDAETPETTTLGTWIGSNTANVKYWHGMTPDNIYDSSYELSGGTIGGSPNFITTGTINTVNGNISINFNGSNSLTGGSGVSALDSGNNFSVFVVSSNTSSNSVGVTTCTSSTSASNFITANDRRTQKRASYIYTNSTYYFSNLISQQNNSNQRLISSIGDTSYLLSSYYNSTFQSSVTYSSTAYINDKFIVGAQHLGGNKLIGSVQEVIIYASDKISDNISDIHTDINDYYSIY